VLATSGRLTSPIATTGGTYNTHWLVARHGHRRPLRSPRWPALRPCWRPERELLHAKIGGAHLFVLRDFAGGPLQKHASLDDDISIVAKSER
jgi:hypothetical protein